MVMPLPDDVAAYAGSRSNTATLATAEAHLPVVTRMVKAYTRGKGFDEMGQPNDELEAVIVSTCARTVANPTAVRSQGIDDATVSYQIVNGWTLAELAVLNRYRKRAL